jgi:hypothetical protein
MSAFGGFLNPFQIDVKDNLFCLSSGAPSTSKVEHDLLNVDAMGKMAFHQFIEDRIVEKNISFHQPIARTALSTFASMRECKKVKNAANKQIEIKAERNLFGQLLLLSEKNNISREKVLSYPLSPVPWALSTADGLPVKTDKAKLMHLLEADVATPVAPKAQESVYVMDGSAVLHALVDLPITFEQVAMMVFDMLPNVARVDFVTDGYVKNSVKEFERLRRGQSPNYIIQGPNTKVPRDWKSFLNNGANKVQLTKLLLSEWQSEKYAPKLQNRHVYFVCGEKCIHLSSDDGQIVRNVTEQQLSSSHEEADTRMILHCIHAANMDKDKVILVRSPDTDVFLLLLKFAQNLDNLVLFDTGVGNKRRLIDVKAVVEKHGADLCCILFSFHSFTGCDTTSAFVRRGKLIPYKTLQVFPQFRSTFASLAVTTDIPETTFEELEHFLCCAYGKSEYTDVNKLRYDMFTQKFKTTKGQTLSISDGVDLSLLPPCRSSLHNHILRCNYQAYVWNMADVAFPFIPSPVGRGWAIDESGQLHIDWVKGDILPKELADIMPDKSVEEEDEFQTNDIEVNNMDDIIYDDES